MFENLTDSFKGMFGKVEGGLCRLTMNGNIAVKCSNGYKTYDVKKGTLTNVTNFCFNVNEMFFVVPTRKAQVGDIILVGGRPKCVTDVNKKVITVIDYENSEVRQVVPERHIFMGSSYYYGKIVSMFGNMFKNGKGASNMIKMMMFSQLMGGNGNGNNMGGLGQLAAMSMLTGNGENPFGGMFDFDLNFGDDEDDEDDETEEEKED